MKLGAAPKKSLGQNFLVNENTSQRIADWANSTGNSLIEIGPGLGALTYKLDKTKLIHLLEIDRAFSTHWREEGYPVTEGDALDFDWNSVEKNGTTLVSNLPYQISSRIVIDRSIGPTSVNRMILMFQKEVAERITCGPKSSDYGMLSVFSQAHWKVEKFLDAGPKDFYPPPQVGSRVLSFQRIDTDFDSQKFLIF